MATCPFTTQLRPNVEVKRRTNAPEVPDTPLQYAAELGNRQVAAMLIEAGAHVNEVGSTGRTGLHYANGHLDVLQLLIARGADVNARDADGASPLDDAAWRGSLDTAALLLAHGARLNDVEPNTGATPINEAAYRGNAKLIRFLLQFHPDVDTADKKGRVALDNAIRSGNEEAAVLLLDAEAKQRKTPQLLATAMAAAINKDESAVVDRILQIGTSPDLALPAGATPLDAAAFTGAMKTVDVLLRHNADPNLVSIGGNSPLDDAALKGFDRIVDTLLHHGAEVNAFNRSGNTALYSAASFGRTAVVVLLLQKGANPNLCGVNHKTSYEAASANGFSDLAGLLLRAGGRNHCESR